MTPGMFSWARSFTSSLRLVVLTAAIALLSRQAIAAVSTAAELFQSGVEALRSSDYATAEASFRKVLQIEPQNLGALGNLGVIYAKTNREGKAIETYRRALKVAPHDEGLLLNLGLAYVKSERYAEALPAFAEVESMDAHSLQARELAATCRIYTGDPENAITSLESLRATDPNRAAVLYLLGVAYTRAKKPELAKPVFAEMLSSATDPAQSSFLLGKVYYDGGQFADAERSFLDVISKDANFPGARLELSKILISERENTRAVEQLNILLQQHPGDANAQYLLGAFDVQLGQYREAEMHLRQAEKSFPNSWALNFYLGKAAYRSNHTGEGIRRLQRAVDLNPEDQSTYYLLSQAYRTAGKTAEAKQALEKVKLLQSRNLQREESAIGRIPNPQ